MTTSATFDAPAEAPRRSAARARWLAVLRTPVGAGAGLLLALVLLLAVIAPLLWSEEADRIDTSAVLQGASADHWVGTDALGRDIFARVLVATRLSIGLALAATSIAVVLGLLLGCAPLLLGRRGGRLVTAGVNIAVAFPGLLLALFFAVVFGVGMTGAVLAIGFAGAPAFARLSHTLAAGVADRDFVSAARIAGVGRFRVLLRHVLPNIGEPLVVNATIGAGGALLAFAGLSFLGLGVQAPSYDWGRLLQDGLSGIYIHPVAALAPGVAIVVAGLAFNLFGEAVAKGIGLTTTLGGGFSPGRAARREVTGPDAVRAVPADQGTPSTDPGPAADRPVLDVQDLSVTFPGPGGPVRPVRGVSFRIGRGEAVGVVGESGSGKSLTALAVARLVEQPGEVTADRLEFQGADLLTGPERAHRRLLGTSFAMVFQDPMTSFNPTRRIGRQLAEVAQEHQGMNRRQALDRAVDRLRSVRVPAAERRAHQYPHEFSGGMRQRAMIGMGLMGEPTLIVADEPTTALDVTVQRQVLDLLAAVRAADGVALLLISHDVAVVGQVCDRVLVMYAGRVVEDLPAAELDTGARHPYTRALVAAVPDMDVDLDAPLPVIPGRPVDPAHQPPGCAYAPRCPLASARCTDEDPVLADDGAGWRVACWHAGEVTDRAVPGAAPVAVSLGERA
ncbi:dipeptide/oligopeptide/nickel ABC transporter permease/ATP-binding protein [Modestobacter sp. VKM Ac-2977]|uniref:dipeptide/oligopeptide/nickel ABC transporter permease/ATP-binding protein n=1 Tax=Modestobacter sp. VKM Ac-2977 TaxID=3004131 RepID=UPI0022AAF01F|nr:dipeptide/oligopeptide/nickel ABC transporter permease/ATP-binding protein [Modestobacter sp. VKM Ac-2977]MCZ2821131.1 dipeptide/oligopeptide/nickel ABC transporter permease/ATP-binding protein [Modestobacter sp. VKM Ac-2977]